ncbi:MAG: tRNA (adenosine(37)-N6)-threonylcarbamoyltransferase complex dimerization subunit type 1 TsaB [Clostridiales bacterium]|nr:tRNA (adenosine(37)-N6)-threonylcarbamoyltransferase complex dimerization subunit type 1 TsaB [Clostridiales bacterium]MDD7034916.1 tRNA (adenosine(37)-N6)-threonylcarbamoyltransferase complex dimerization subunit type 1 TsaB [Bacillota bacterium]MDY2920323.1 tRNA (adenosine(37)-N6)-threonylcarbamoyltransferase complex dimerization subunit type 1 TsaB [Lentihominibacter sp.]
MNILAIETTGAFASVAAAYADVSEGRLAEFEIRAHVQGHDEFSHLQNLTPQIDEALSDAGLKIGDVDAIAVSCGPGSFTGIRIGVSTARALAQVLDLPCIPVLSLKALSMRIDGEGALVCPILDARRSQVYGAGYAPEEIIPPGPYTLEEFLDKVEESGRERVIFMGDGVDKYAKAIEDRASAGGVRVDFAPEDVRYQDAETVALQGARLAAEGRSCSYGELEPEYMRMAEAERRLREKKAEEADG